MVNKFKEFVLECLFPTGFECIVCGDELNCECSHSMCDDCLNSLPQILKECKRCGVSITGNGKYCLACKEKKYSFKRAVACFDYSDKVINLLHALKYGGARYLAKPLASFMFERLNKESFEIDFITYVPIGEGRLRERGYNQAELLAREVAKNTNLEVFEILQRTKETPTQAKLTRLERRENLKGAFVVFDAEKVKGKNILLIDDVMTTGATCDEIAKVLLKAKAKAVFALTFAHTALKQDNLMQES